MSVRCILLLVIALTISGCSSVQYYSQSVVGHSRLMLARQSIDKVIDSADPQLKSQLLLARQVRKFAVDEIALPDNKSYLYYVDLQRDYPVWTVVAAEEFSLQPKSWCYLVIGCAAYRGYYSYQAALEYAKHLQQKGFEISVDGAIAYSTLGWFADPLLPSMMRDGDAYLVETMFHELAHQVLYVKGDSELNEAFASVVGEQATLSWLTKTQPDKVTQYQVRLERRKQFYQLLRDLKQQLQDLYDSSQTGAVKRQRKQLLIQQVRAKHEQLKTEQWQGNGFDAWFARPINNARLAAVSTYREKMPAFEYLLEQCDTDYRRFFAVLKSDDKNALKKAVPTECH